MKNKKILWYILIGLDVALTAVLFVISIIMLANTSKEAAELEAMGGMIGFFFKNTGAFLGIIVIPLFVLLAANIIGLVVYVRKSTKSEPVKVKDLTEEQKEALRQELLKDLSQPKDGDNK